MDPQQQFVADLAVAQDLYTIEIVDVDKGVINVHFAGREGTPYEGGTFEVQITFGPIYLVSHTLAFFQTPVWNDLVNARTAKVIFETYPYSVSDAIEYVLSSMDVPSHHYEDEFVETALFWIRRYASAPGEQDFAMQAKVDHLMEIGMEEHQVIAALSSNKWNIEDAMEDILAYQVEEEFELASELAGPSGVTDEVFEDAPGTSDEGQGSSK